MPPHPPEPYLVHPLPSAPDFLGREAEREQLHAFWLDGGSGVLSLVGLGGAGKTALTACFVSDLLDGRADPVPDGLFVWSFYQEPDAGLFLRELFDYFNTSAASHAPAQGAGLLPQLRDLLHEGGRFLLILDGLERVQRQAGDASYGRIDDPLLKSLLIRIAEGLGQTAVLTTSRFPLTDLAAWRGGGYCPLEVGELTLPAALALLRRRGVHGDDEELAALATAYGAHALTLDHLGGLIGQFLDGDPKRAPEAPTLSARSDDRQALRLGRLLAAYEKHLPAAELALLCRLCMLRRSVRLEQIVSLFLCSPPVRARTIRDLAHQSARKLRALPIHEEALPRLGVTRGESLPCLLEEVLEKALFVASLAGPEETFRREILAEVERAIDSFQSEDYLDVEELALQYAHAESLDATEKHPLPPKDRLRLRFLYDKYRRLREHPLAPFQSADPLLSAAFVNLGWKPPRGPEDVGPVDVLRGLQYAERQLRWLALKHRTLQRVHQLCRLSQQKWVLAGPLAPLGSDQLREILDALESRHLVLRETDGSYTAHPAVRDHFARLGSAPERGSQHALLRLQLMSLVHQPGLRHPCDRLTLDLIEEAIYHAQQAGQNAEAIELYESTLGGLRHLGWKLGEMARGLRILRGFDPCPDRWALGWFLRALGEFEDAYAHNELPYFRADIRLLQGRLPEVSREGEDTRTAVAEFLMGRTSQAPPSVLGCAVPRAHVLLYLGRLWESFQIAQLDPLYHDLGREGDRARCLLIAAEAARRQAETEASAQDLQTAATWIRHSGSVEHLCLYHLVRARLAHDKGERENAQRAVNEGLYLGRTCRLGLYHIELLCLQAEINLARGDAPAAERMASEALWRSSADDCRFAWGESEARHLLGKALAAQQRLQEARGVLEAAQELRRRIGDPRLPETERLLACVCGEIRYR